MHSQSTDQLFDQFDELYARLEPFSDIFATLATTAAGDRRLEPIALRLCRIKAVTRKLEKIQRAHEQRFEARLESRAACLAFDKATRRYLKIKIVLIQDVLTLAYAAEAIIHEYDGRPRLCA